jgi:hypothetical protein
MTFAERFDAFVCEGDSISCEVAGFEIIAQIVHAIHKRSILCSRNRYTGKAIRA